MEEINQKNYAKGLELVIISQKCFLRRFFVQIDFYLENFKLIFERKNIFFNAFFFE